MIAVAAFIGSASPFKLGPTASKGLDVPKEITPQELARRLAAGEPTHLIDVREPWENQIAALAGSVLIPLNRLAAGVELKTSPGAMVVAYCHHGVRSLHAAAILEHYGVANVVSLAGGIDAWSAEVDSKMPRY